MGLFAPQSPRDIGDGRGQHPAEGRQRRAGDVRLEQQPVRGNGRKVQHRVADYEDGRKGRLVDDFAAGGVDQ
jgi:hypothetical protein